MMVGSAIVGRRFHCRLIGLLGLFLHLRPPSPSPSSLQHYKRPRPTSESDTAAADVDLNFPNSDSAPDLVFRAPKRHRIAIAVGAGTVLGHDKRTTSPDTAAVSLYKSCSPDDDDDDDNPVVTNIIPPELFWEILRWVPVKPLMRLKCVSRIWKSIVTDPLFARDYRGGSRGILGCQHAIPWPLERVRCFYFVAIYGDAGPTPYNQFSHTSSTTSDSDDDDDDDDAELPDSANKYDCFFEDDIPTRICEISHYSTLDHGDEFTGITDVINGLCCYYNRNHSYLYNIATRETLQLPVSENESLACSYHLGFDPVNNAYKLLKTCPVYRNFDERDRFYYEGLYFVGNSKCEILTIGVDSSWRTVDNSLPPLEIQTQSSCLDGALYWLTLAYVENSLVAFHLDGERFELIPLPTTQISHCYRLLIHGTSLAVSSARPFQNEGGRNFEIHIHRHLGDGKWDDPHRIFFLINTEGYFAEAQLPDGRLMLLPSEWTQFPAPLYLFDPTRNELEKLVMDVGPPPSSFHSVFLANGRFDCEFSWRCYFEENIIPLGCLASSSSSGCVD